MKKKKAKLLETARTTPFDEALINNAILICNPETNIGSRLMREVPSALVNIDLL
jgi:hypothetical protein